MKKLKENIIIILVAGVLALGIIQCQKAQRRCNVELEGQKGDTYYQYLDYMQSKSLKNN